MLITWLYDASGSESVCPLTSRIFPDRGSLT